MTTKHERAGWDGVGNVKYRLDSVIANDTFTTIRVDLRRFITHNIDISVDNRPLLNMTPQIRSQCSWVSVNGTYLDSTFIKVLSKDQRHAFSFNEAKSLCDGLGQACSGFVREFDYTSGQNYFPREKSVLTSTNNGKSNQPVSYIKVCPGEMSQNFPILEPVAEATYSASFKLEVVVPLSVSLVYRDTGRF